MTHVFYNIIIYPIELILEIVFSVIYEFRHDAGMSILGVSLILNILLLPLYARAEQIAEEERGRQKDMEKWIAHIRGAFRGDERFLILSAYYRKMGYHPVYALKSSISLLLQIPFFFAAYHFLANLSILRGTGFFGIADLGKPDSMIIFPAAFWNVSAGLYPIGPIAINVLPILMTLINIISILVYTNKGLKENIQLYLLAVFFLIFLYNSPSGLVLYWTANNLFSLGKNLVFRFWKKKPSLKKAGSGNPPGLAAYFCGAVLMVVLLGMLIPSSVLVSSPLEFITMADYHDPLQYVFSSACIASGFFLFWLTVFYLIGRSRTRRALSLGLWVLCGIALLDFLAFGKNTVNLSTELSFDYEPVRTGAVVAANLAAVILVSAVFLYIWKKKRSLVIPIYGILIFSTAVLFIVNTAGIETKLARSGYASKDAVSDSFGEENITLSRHGRNVVVIMLDRAIGAYIPFLMTERPELMNRFAGFTYYPNTMSLGSQTMSGAPALFGGYEYAPEAMNRRKEERMVDKHNEALSVMPVIFSEKGFRTTVFDPPLANYEDIGDLSIYDPWPKIHRGHLMQRFVEPEYHAMVELIRRRSFFMYSIYKSAPLLLQHSIYDDGMYHYPDSYEAPHRMFNDSYSILKNFPSITKIEDSDEDTFMMMASDITHSPAELQLPDYAPSPRVRNEGLEPGVRVDMNGNEMEVDIQFHYHVDMAAFLLLGDWLDFLRENGVYDNTRIILVADHGAGLGQFDSLILDDGSDMEALNPLLMVKDFDSEVFSASMDFMTNADTPYLAMKDLMEKPANPFTGKEFEKAEKQGRVQEALIGGLSDEMEREHTFPGGDWYSCHDNIYVRENWERRP